MKKILCLFIFAIFALGPGLCADQGSVETIIASTTLDDDPTVISGTKYVQSADKIAFFVTYDETEVGGGLSVAVTCLVSVDDVTYLAASFYDYAGGATLQTSETLSADGNYYFWFDKNLTMPYVKITITATNSDVDDTALVSAKIITQE